MCGAAAVVPGNEASGSLGRKATEIRSLFPGAPMSSSTGLFSPRPTHSLLRPAIQTRMPFVRSGRGEGGRCRLKQKSSRVNVSSLSRGSSSCACGDHAGDVGGVGRNPAAAGSPGRAGPLSQHRDIQQYRRSVSGLKRRPPGSPELICGSCAVQEQHGRWEMRRSLFPRIDSEVFQGEQSVVTATSNT